MFKPPAGKITIYFFADPEFRRALDMHVAKRGENRKDFLHRLVEKEIEEELKELERYRGPENE